jgi:DNA modification methylase
MTNLQNNLEIRYIPIRDLIPYARNAKIHDERQIAQIAGSLKEFGFINPVIVDKDRSIVAGHGRVLAAQQLGLAEVPTLCAEHLTPVQVKAFRLADNRIAQNGAWDQDLLKLELEELDNLGIDLEGLGFDVDELPSAQGTDGLTDPDDVPETPKDVWVKPGDLFEMGGHRLLCGDSTKAEDVARLMNGEKADMVFTDPPYNHASDNELMAASVSHGMQRLKDSEWDKGFDITRVFPVLESALAENSTVYICTSWHLAGDIWAWMRTRSSHYSYCVWHKPNPMPSLAKRHWTWSSELICYATFGKHTFNFPEEGHAPNVWTFNKNAKNDLHPTMKPVELVEHAVNHSSTPNAKVLDLFGGAGSTLIACEKTGRRCYGMEISPEYIQVCLERWSKFTGKQWTKLE